MKYHVPSVRTDLAIRVEKCNCRIHRYAFRCDNTLLRNLKTSYFLIMGFPTLCSLVYDRSFFCYDQPLTGLLDLQMSTYTVA